MVAYIKFQENF